MSGEIRCFVSAFLEKEEIESQERKSFHSTKASFGWDIDSIDQFRRDSEGLSQANLLDEILMATRSYMCKPFRVSPG